MEVGVIDGPVGSPKVSQGCPWLAFVRLWASKGGDRWRGLIDMGHAFIYVLCVRSYSEIHTVLLITIHCANQPFNHCLSHSHSPSSILFTHAIYSQVMTTFPCRIPRHNSQLIANELRQRQSQSQS